MGLIGNGNYYSPRSGLLPGWVSAVGSCKVSLPFFNPVSHRRLFDSDIVSFPVGYYQNGSVLPMKMGGIACMLRGGSTLGAVIAATASLASSLSGGGVLSVYGYKGLNGAVTVTGSGALSAGISAKANIACTITIGAQPSAFDIAQAIWGASATQYNAPGTMGQKLNGAGSAGDPWTTALPGSYAPGTAGFLIGNPATSNGGLTLAQFLALK